MAGGRWNRKGIPLVYTSATLSLAASELFVHLDPDQTPADLVSISAEIPEDARIREVRVAELPRDWRSYPAPEALALLGSAWADSLDTAVLAVPSAVIPLERNYLLNVRHRDFARIRVNRPAPFSLDPRVWKAKRK